MMDMFEVVLRRVLQEVKDIREHVDRLEVRVGRAEVSSEASTTAVAEVKASVISTLLSTGMTKGANAFQDPAQLHLLDDLRQDARHLSVLKKSFDSLEDRVADMHREIAAVEVRQQRQEEAQQSFMNTARHADQVQVLKAYLTDIETMRDRSTMKQPADPCGVGLSRDLERCIQSEQDARKLSEENARLRRESRRQRKLVKHLQSQQSMLHSPPRAHDQVQHSMLSEFGQYRHNITMRGFRAPLQLELADRLSRSTPAAADAVPKPTIPQSVLRVVTDASTPGNSPPRRASIPAAAAAAVQSPPRSPRKSGLNPAHAHIKRPHDDTRSAAAAPAPQSPPRRMSSSLSNAARGAKRGSGADEQEDVLKVVKDRRRDSLGSSAATAALSNRRVLNPAAGSPPHSPRRASSPPGAAEGGARKGSSSVKDDGLQAGGGGAPRVLHPSGSHGSHGGGHHVTIGEQPGGAGGRPRQSSLKRGLSVKSAAASVASTPNDAHPRAQGRGRAKAGQLSPAMSRSSFNESTSICFESIKGGPSLNRTISSSSIHPAELDNTPRHAVLTTTSSSSRSSSSASSSEESISLEERDSDTMTSDTDIVFHEN
ncbi:hypothetical protein DIPPA_35124 [Diplonema papillatum]|nr:hypothetical protein DIPPA_35124 [Diplonema papillatum]